MAKAWLREAFTVPAIGQVGTMTLTEGSASVFKDGDEVVIQMGEHEFAGIVNNPKYLILGNSFTFVTVTRTTNEIKTVKAGRLVTGHGQPPDEPFPSGPGQSSARLAAS